MYSLQNQLKAKKVLNSSNWSFHKWQYWIFSNIDNAQDCGHVQNILNNLGIELIQCTDQQKVVKQAANSWN